MPQYNPPTEPSIANTFAISPPLYAYTFAAVTGTETLTGFFVDVNSLQVTPLQTFSITTAVTLTDLYADNNSEAPIPPNCCAFLWSLATENLFIGLAGKTDGTINYFATPGDMDPGAGYPQVVTAVFGTFGKVA